MDAIDRQILNLLAEDARMSLKTLSASVGLSSPSTSERLRRLEESGGSLLSKSLMRTHLIEDATEVVEAPLLGTQAFGHMGAQRHQHVGPSQQQ